MKLGILQLRPSHIKVKYRSNQSFNAHPPPPGHLTVHCSQGGGKLNVALKGWGIWTRFISCSGIICLWFFLAFAGFDRFWISPLLVNNSFKRVFKAAFTRQTNFGQLMLANSNWCVWTTQQRVGKLLAKNRACLYSRQLFANSLPTCYVIHTHQFELILPTHVSQHSFGMWRPLKRSWCVITAYLSLRSMNSVWLKTKFVFEERYFSTNWWDIWTAFLPWGEGIWTRQSSNAWELSGGGGGNVEA